MRVIFLTGCLLACVGFAAGAVVKPENPIPEHKLVRVELEEGERAWILSSSFEPVDVVQVGTKLLVWTGPPGKYAVLSWTETAQSQKIVVIQGGTPEPPDPPDPQPSKVLNDFGIGLVAYQEAKKIGRPVESKDLATAARLALQKLVEGKTTPAGAESYLRARREALASDWTPWETAVEKAIAAAIKKYGSGSLRYRDYMLEIAVALEEAAK